MKKKLLLGGIAAALIATGVGFAANTGGTTTAVTAGTGVTITAATTGTPAWDAPINDMAGNIAAGKLYDIAATSEADQKTVRLYLANADELKQAYHFATQDVKIAKKVTAQDGTVSYTDVDQQLLSLENGYVEFKVDGGQEYRISVVGGGFKTKNIAAGELAPTYATEVK